MPLHNLIKSVDENVIKYIHAVTKRKNVASTQSLVLISAFFLSFLLSLLWLEIEGTCRS